MNRRFEDRFKKAQVEKLQDPLLLAGINPEIFDAIEDTHDRKTLVESLIRKHWEQVHPDLAKSPADREHREHNRRSLEGALKGVEKLDINLSIQQFRSLFRENILRTSNQLIDERCSKIDDVDIEPGDTILRYEVLDLGGMPFTDTFLPYDMRAPELHRGSVPFLALINADIEVFNLDVAGEILHQAREELKNTLADLASIHGPVRREIFLERFSILEPNPSFAKFLLALGCIGPNYDEYHNKQFLKTLRADFFAECHRRGGDLDMLVGGIAEFDDSTPEQNTELANYEPPALPGSCFQEAAAIWNGIVAERAVNLDFIRAIPIYRETLRSRVDERMDHLASTISDRCLKEISNLPHKVLHVNSRGYIEEGGQERKLLATKPVDHLNSDDLKEGILKRLVKHGLKSSDDFKPIDKTSEVIKENPLSKTAASSDIYLKSLMDCSSDHEDLLSLDGDIDQDSLCSPEKISFGTGIYSAIFQDGGYFLNLEGYLLSIRAPKE